MKIIYNDGTVAECPAEDELHVIRHSAAHILAQAIKHLYPQAHFAYGPATEKGFHYDVDLGDVKLSDEDFPAIEKEMQSIVKQNLPIKPFALSREEAVKPTCRSGAKFTRWSTSPTCPRTPPLTFYQQGDFTDLCAGPAPAATPRPSRPSSSPHSPAPTGGATRRTRCSRRVYGTAFRKPGGAGRIPQACWRRPRSGTTASIGKEMDLFMLLRRGPRLPLLPAQGHGPQKRPGGLLARDPPQGTAMWRSRTPLILNRHLWETQRPLGSLQGQHVHHQHRRRGLLPSSP